MEARVRKFILAFFLCALAALPAKRHLAETTEGPAGLILQQIIQEPDATRRLEYLRMFLERFPQHESYTWVLGEAQTHYLAAKDFDNVLRAGETLLLADPADLPAAHTALQAAQAKGAANLVQLWAQRTADAALRAEPSDYARQCLTYAEYFLYAPALQSSDPKVLQSAAARLEKANPASEYLPQLRARIFQLHRQSGNIAQTLALAEAKLKQDPNQPDMLLFLASHYYDGLKDPQKAIAYAKRLIAPTSKAAPSQAALGHTILGVIASQDARLADAELHLRAAIPHLDPHPALKSEALFHLGLAHYRLGESKQDLKRIEQAYKLHAECATLAGPFRDQAASSAAGIRSQYHLK
jgi:tetratricopeptide (TPR) repeat protein